MKSATFLDCPITAWKVSKYGVISGPYFPVFGQNMEIYGVFSPNTGKHGPEITPYLDTFHAVIGQSRKVALFKNDLTYSFLNKDFCRIIMKKIGLVKFLHWW